MAKWLTACLGQFKMLIFNALKNNWPLPFFVKKSGSKPYEV